MITVKELEELDIITNHCGCFFEYCINDCDDDYIHGCTDRIFVVSCVDPDEVSYSTKEDFLAAHKCEGCKWYYRKDKKPWD